MLLAFLLIFSFTFLGYLRIGVVEITFNMLPVVLGSVLISPGYGALLGLVFGATSFLQCFGTSTFGTLLFGINPFLTVLICFIPRIIAGFLPGVFYRLITKKEKHRLAGYTVAAASGSLLNSVLFVGGFCLLFKDTMLGMAGDMELSPFMFIATVFIINSLCELLACTVICTALLKAYEHFSKGGKNEFR